MVVSLLLALTACHPLAPWPVDDGGAPLDQRITVSPGTVDFGSVSVNEQGEAIRILKVYNLGEDTVTVTGQDEPIGDDGVFRVDAGPVLSLEPGEERELTVTFIPETEGDSLARLRFDPGSEVVELRGSGTAPVLQVRDVEIPATVLGCSGVGQVTVANTGSEPLSLDAGMSGEGFSATGWPPEVPVGEEAQIDVTFTPGGGGEWSGVLTLTTNDPMQPEVAVQVDALGYEGEGVRERFVYAPAAPTDTLVVVEGNSFAADPRLDEALSAYAARVHDAWLDVQLTSLGSGSACPADVPAWTTADASELAIANVLKHGFEARGGAWDTDLVGLVERALFETEPGGCLDGLRRAGASLDVVLVAADPPTEDAVAAFAAVASALPDGTPVRVSALVPRSGECGDTDTSYATLASTWSGVVGDLCATSWTAAFEAFAALPVIHAEARFPLAEVPVPSSIEVSADGAPFTGWSWDAAENTIVVPAEDAPTVGAELTVDYVSAVSCGG